MTQGISDVCYDLLARIRHHNQRGTTMDEDFTMKVTLNTMEMGLVPIGFEPGAIVSFKQADDNVMQIEVTTFGGIDGFDPEDREGLGNVFSALAETLLEGTITRVVLPADDEN